MAMIVTNPINTDGVSAVPGASNRALGLKLYTGEVIKEFDRMNIAKGTVKNRMISGGKSAQFIVTGQDADTGTTTHTPGATVVASVMKVDERVITIADRIYFAHFVDDLDLKLSQYDIRGELAKQAAEALATKIDKEIFALIKTAVGTAGVADQAAGTTVTNTTIASASTTEAKGDAIVESIFELNAQFNGKDVPMSGRIFVTTPSNYAAIVQSQKAVNRDFTNGNGGIDTGTVLNIAGTPILWSNHLGLAAGDEGLFYAPGCVGVVTAMDITSEANYIPQELGSLLTSYYALGMGVLRPAEAGLLRSAV